MAYQVLARKWRPQRFSEVVGQEHITRTLQNAILQNRVGHAYLFVGPRGIGKTTTARVFAKALNCDQGMAPEPCCQCTSCQEIAQGSCLDVTEIDGASHNKVEDIRDLRDRVHYAPSRCRFRIYIIDEVHMLTPGAWNALLKTLEEPPAHVKFLFATTEAHKVLPTITSRCQRFDLRSIPVPLIAARLRQIADQEGIHADDGALAAIARAADGGMRDAQSIFDQIIAFCGGQSETERIREQDVIDVFGLASGAELHALAEGMLRNDLDAVLGVVQSLADRGRDLERLFGDLVGYVRGLMVCTVCRDPARVLQTTPAELEGYQALARAADPGLIQRLLQGLVGEEWSFRSALNKRLYLEAALARVAFEAHSVQLDDILAHLIALRDSGQMPEVPAPARAGTGPRPSPPAMPARDPAPPQPPVSARDPGPPQPVAPTEPPPARAAAPVPQPPAAPQEAPQEAPAAELPAPAPEGAPAAGPRGTLSAEQPAREPPVARAQDGPASQSPAPAAQQAGAGDAPPIPQPGASLPSAARTAPLCAEPPPDGDSSAAAAVRGATPAPRVECPAPEPRPPPEASASAASPPAVAAAQEAQPEPQALFQKLLAELGRDPRGTELLPLVKRLRPVSIIEGTLHLAFDAETFPPEEMARLRAPETTAALGECLSRAAGATAASVVLKRWIAAVSDERHDARRRATPEDRQRIAGLPFVRQVCRLVGGEVVDVRVSMPELRRGEA